MKTIRDLIFLIRHTGSLRVAGYGAELTDYPGEYLTFDGDEFKFSFSDMKLADEFIMELGRLNN